MMQHRLKFYICLFTSARLIYKDIINVYTLLIDIDITRVLLILKNYLTMYNKCRTSYKIPRVIAAILFFIFF